ncbi:MAG: hypothetical protein H0W73_06915 [Bacteroidetes bacterium]|nr:hypothetical protein [Bacteroidota bacterium]
MKKTIWKSIGAILTGFILAAFLSIATDMILNLTNIVNMESFKDNSAIIILFVIIYRFIYNVMGCYLTSKLAPNKPMKHALIIGVIGTVFALLGSIAMWDKAVAWYNISVILISLPSAWVGAKLFMMRKSKKETSN